MLVSFALTNYACYRERQEISMEAVPRTPADLAFDTDVSRFRRLNRVTAIYGANASGKSRLLQGLHSLRQIVLNSARESQAGDKIDVVPHLFDRTTRGQPSVFEVCFIEKGTAYEYGVSVDSNRVHEEWLMAWPPGRRMHHLLHRRYDDDAGQEEWRLGASVRGPKSLWRASTRENALFVSVAAQLNSEAFRPVVDWFTNLGFLVGGDLALQHTPYTAHQVIIREDLKGRLVALLRDAGVPVVDIDVRRIPITREEIAPYVSPKQLSQFKEGDTMLNVRLGHATTSEKPWLLDLHEESDGTQRLFALAGPWLDVLDNDRVVVVDELERSLHPLLVAALVARFTPKRSSRRNSRAQLIATMHDVTLLQRRLHSGQVWFTEKVRDRDESQIVPLSDYRLRRKGSLMADYMDGRYGGVPVIAREES